MNKRGGVNEMENDSELKELSKLINVHSSKNIRKAFERAKRQLNTTNQTLAGLKEKCSLLESENTAILRSWSQLENDTLNILKIYGYEDNDISDFDGRRQSLVAAFIKNCGFSKSDINRNPTTVDDDMSDEWTTSSDIDKEKELLIQCLEADSEDWRQSSDDTCNIPSPHELSSDLQRHVNFANSLFTKLCNITVERAQALEANAQAVEKVKLLAQQSAMHSKYTFLVNHMLRLARDRYEIRAQLRHAEKQLAEARAQLDAQTSCTHQSDSHPNADETTNGIITQNSAVSTSGSTNGVYPIPTDENAGVCNGGQSQLDVLQKQLADSESQRRRLEGLLVDKVCEPRREELRVRLLISQLRAVTDQRETDIADYTKEKTALREQIQSLEADMASLAKSASEQVMETIARAKAETEAANADRDEIQRLYDVANAELQHIASQTVPLSEAMAALESISRDNQEMRGVVVEMERRELVHMQYLASARENARVGESEVERGETRSRSGSMTAIAAAAGGAAAASASSPAGGVNTSKSLQSAHERELFLEGEVQRLTAVVTAFQPQLDSLSRKNSEYMADNVRLLGLVSRSKTMEDDVIRENGRLLREMDRLENVEALAASRLEDTTALSHSQFAEINRLREHVYALRADLNTQLARSDEMEAKCLSASHNLETMDLQIEEADSGAQEEKRKQGDIRRLHEELQTKYNNERTKRLSAERALNSLMTTAATAAKKTKAADPSIDVDKLTEHRDRLRKIVHCSVCQEDFKQIIIRKCWHMFCKKCTDENIRTRNRKCPMCGQKFEQTDVQEIFF